MRNIIWIGEPFFSASLEDCGWETVRVLPGRRDSLWTWQSIVAQAGMEPDVIVVAGSGEALRFNGLEQLPCLTVYYEPDWLLDPLAPVVAQAFDAAMPVHRQHVGSFTGAFLAAHRVRWLPAYARGGGKPDFELEKSLDCLLVDSTLDHADTGIRGFMEQFASQPFVTVHERPGWPVHAGSSRTVLLQPNSGEFGFSLFNALGNGACVVTPRVENGLETLFVDGEHFVGFSPNDVGDAVYRVNFLLQDDELANYVARTGWEEINQHHRALSRAQEFTDFICDLAMEEGASASRCERSADILRRELLPAYQQKFEATGQRQFYELFQLALNGMA